MDRIIFVSEGYIHTAKKNNIYINLVTHGKISKNWVKIHKNFYESYYYIDLTRTADYNQFQRVNRQMALLALSQPSHNIIIISDDDDEEITFEQAYKCVFLY